jgi:hypothetical protein
VVGILSKILDLALILIPLVIEWFRKKRDDGEKASEYVRRRQKEKLKTYETILKGDGKEITRAARMRIDVARRVLARVRSDVRKPAS